MEALLRAVVDDGDPTRGERIGESILVRGNVGGKIQISEDDDTAGDDEAVSLQRGVVTYRSAEQACVWVVVLMLTSRCRGCR